MFFLVETRLLITCESKLTFRTVLLSEQIKKEYSFFHFIQCKHIKILPLYMTSFTQDSVGDFSYFPKIYCGRERDCVSLRVDPLVILPLSLLNEHYFGTTDYFHYNPCPVNRLIMYHFWSLFTVFVKNWRLHNQGKNKTFTESQWRGISLAVRLLGLCASTAGGEGSIPGQGTNADFPHACSAAKKKKKVLMKTYQLPWLC